MCLHRLQTGIMKSVISVYVINRNEPCKIPIFPMPIIGNAAQNLGTEYNPRAEGTEESSLVSCFFV